MLKLIVILLCTSTLGSADVLDLLRNLVDYGNESPIKVRTIKEYNEIKNYSAVLDFVGFVHQFEGYKAEEYEVITEDNYILKIHRIYANSSSPEAKGKPVVYLQHGLFSSSDFFIILGPEHSFAFQLADAGYDVWLGNVRGNTYSRSHLEIDPEDSKFWDFSMDEMGLIDLSKSIDTVLNITKHEKLTYIGYSLGTTLSYILLSSKLEYNRKINLMISVAPTAYYIPPGNSIIDRWSKRMILYSTYIVRSKELLPRSIALAKYANEFCIGPGENICKSVFSEAFNVSDVEDDFYAKFLAYQPAGMSLRTLEHIQQINGRGEFTKYDFPCGLFHPSCLNHEMYNQSTPPEYDVSVITVPNAMLYSPNDSVTTLKDVMFLKNKLRNVVVFEDVKEAKVTVNHLDFFLSKSTRTLVYKQLLKMISDHL